MITERMKKVTDAAAQIISDLLAETVRKYEAEIASLREQVAAGDALRISMADVPENILDWASYASEHFQEKYGMPDDADRYKKALFAYDAAKLTQLYQKVNQNDNARNP